MNNRWVKGKGSADGVAGGKRDLSVKNTILGLAVSVIIISAVLIAYGQFEQKRNANLIVDISADFSALVGDIGGSTGLELDTVVECSGHEGGSVDSCYVSSGVALAAAGDKVDVFVDMVLSSPKFEQATALDDGAGYEMKYRGNKICLLSISVRSDGAVSFYCSVDVHSANSDLARLSFDSI